MSHFLPRLRVGLTFASAAGTLLLATTAFAAGKHCPTPRGTDYLPQTNRYVIVQPQQLAPPQSPHNRPCTWPLVQLQAQAYPYGWFGARATTQPSRRGSFYGDTIDYQWRSAP